MRTYIKELFFSMALLKPATAIRNVQAIPNNKLLHILQALKPCSQEGQGARSPPALRAVVPQGYLYTSVGPSLHFQIPSGFAHN